MNAGAWTRPTLNLSLAAWRAMRARRREPIARGLALRFLAAGAAFSALGALQRRMYRAELERLAIRPPLFLVGHWRSGTTLLHELLALDRGFAAPTTHACFNPHHFLLARHRAPAPARAMRPPGDLAVSPDSPQEQEFALLCMGAVSPYEAFMFPAALTELEALSDPDRFEPARARAWDGAMTWILKATVYASGAERRPLLKSPSDSFRVRRLAALFPGAAFVRLVREPCAVFASTLRLWQSMWARYALTPPPGDEALIGHVLATRLALERRLQAALRALPADRTATLRYEDLVADPRGTLAMLYDRLALGDPSTLLPHVDAYIARHPAPAAAAQSAEPWRDLVRERWRQMFDEFGYARG